MMDRFEIEGQTYLRLPFLGLQDFKRFNQNVRKLGYESLSELLELGASRLFNSEGIYLFLALLFFQDGRAKNAAMSDHAVSKRQARFRKYDLEEQGFEPEIVGEAITFFFEKLISLSQSSPTTLYLILKGEEKAEKKNPAKKRTGKRSSKRSRSSLPKATPLSVVSSKT